MRKLIYTLGLIAAAGTAGAGEMLLVSDEELDSVYAQFGGAGDAVIDSTGSIDPSLIGDDSVIISLPEQMGLGGQVIVSENAQQNAFNPVNASNSAVSNVYNIFIIIESNWENVTVNIDNAVDTINSSNLMGGTY